jgi:hypothetical protein
MLRLMGLPHVTRFPKVTVTRYEDRFELLFHGAEHSSCIDIDLRYVEDAADLETTELRLLAASRNSAMRSSAVHPSTGERGRNLTLPAPPEVFGRFTGSTRRAEAAPLPQLTNPCGFRTNFLLAPLSKSL